MPRRSLTTVWCGALLAVCMTAGVRAQTDVLVHSGGAFSTTLETSALDILGFTYTQVFDEASAVAEMTATFYDKVMWVQPNFLMTDAGAQALIDYVALGGKVIFSYWDLDGSSGSFPLLTDLQATFGVAAATGMAPALPVYPEAGSTAHPIWDGPGGFFTDLAIAPVGYGDLGDFLTASTGTVIATFEPTGTVLTEAAIIVDNGDSTVVNGFTHEDIDATQIAGFLANEVMFIDGGVPPCEGPTNLICTTVSCPDGDIDLTWDNPALADYTDIEVLRDGVQVATLLPGTTAYSDPSVPGGVHNYVVRGILCASTGTASVPAFCTVAHCLNDTCDTAYTVDLGVPAAFDTGDALTGTFASCFFGTPTDLWYVFTPATDGSYRVSTCAAGGDTQIAIWDSCGGLELACSDDDCGLSTRIVFDGLAATSYYIQVAGWGAGTVASELLVEEVVPPANDTCDTREIVSDGTFPFDTSLGTPTGLGPVTCAFGADTANDVWYEYTATCDGAARIETCGSTYDTVLAAWDVCDGTEIACNDDACGLQSRISMPVTTGDVIIVEVAGYNGASGPGTITFECIPTAANDTCDTALPVTIGTPEPFDTFAAILAGTPASCFFGTPNDLWYSVDIVTDGAYRVSTCAGGGDTQLAIYDACGGTELACSDDFCGLSSQADFTGVAGTTYYIQVAGWGTGTVASELLITEVIPDDNDTCLTAIAIALDVPEPIDTNPAQLADATPGCWFGQPYDQWYSIDITADGWFNASTCAGGGDTQLAVYDTCGGIEIACSDDDCGTSSSASFQGLAGTTYYIQVAGWGGGGTVISELLVTEVFPAGNDTCDTATPLTLGVAEPFDTSTGVIATTPASCFTGSAVDLWYSIEILADGFFRASSCGGGDTQLAVYDACGGIEIDCNDDSCGLGSEVSFDGLAGTTYYIQVEAWNGGTVAADILVEELIPAGNDTCDLATPVTLGTPEPFDTSLAAIASTPAACFFGTPIDVWFSVDTPNDGVYKASTCAGGGDTQIAVYDACGGLELACADDTCGLSTEVTWSGVAGSTYYIQVAGWGGGTVASELLVFEFTIEPTLVHSGGAFDTTREAQAMDLLGLPYTLVTSAAEASDLMAANPFDLVIWVQPNFLMGDAEAQLLMDYVDLEGRVLFSYWDLDGSSSAFPLLADLRTKFGVESAVDDFGTQNPVYPEASSGSHPVWDGTGGTFTELATIPVGYGDHGDYMVASTGTAVGTFDVTGDASTQACIIIDNADRTIVNSFTHEDIDGIQIVGFLANEIEFLNVGGPTGTEFVRGDANDDGTYDISDAVFTLSALFVPGSAAPNCLDSADSNDDGNFDISDAVFSLSALFVPGSPAPPAPHPACGLDLTDTDPLDCACFNSCGTPCP